MGRSNSSIPPLLVGLAALSTGCGALKTLGIVPNGPAEPDPTPAANELSVEADETHVVPLSLESPDDHTVRIVVGTTTCSGTLIADDQVLTAHHCVAKRNDYGDILEDDVDSESIRVELGGDYLSWGEVGVRAIVAPSCGHKAGTGDIAILMLSRRLESTPTLNPRLDGPPKVGETIRPIGFGRCALSKDGIRRHERATGKIDKVISDRFKLEASICPGDSGGPAISVERGDLVGVISASVMDGNAQTRGRSEFTRLDHWRPIFANAKLLSEGAEAAELPPIDCGEPIK